MKSVNKALVGTDINGLEINDYYSHGRRQFFECYCVCGKLFQARADGIKSGAVRSCGCLTGDLISKKNRLPDNLGAVNLVYRYYKRNAQKRGFDFSLTIGQFKELIFANCAYCGSEPTLSTFKASEEGRRDRELIYNGVDRSNSDLGYVVGNCVSCCHICNRAKSDLSLEDFHTWIRKVIKFNV